MIIVGVDKELRLEVIKKLFITLEIDADVKKEADIIKEYADKF